MGDKTTTYNSSTVGVGRGATRILLGWGGLKNEKFCDVILITYFRWRNL